MSALVVNNGLQRIGIQASEAVGYDAARNIQTMAWDDSSNALTATDTALDDGGAVSNEFDQVFDATPTVTSQTIGHTSTIGTGDGNFTIRRITLHDDTAANVSTSSDTLVSGVDGQAFTKTSDFTLETLLNHLYSNA